MQDMIEVMIDSIRVHLMAPQRVVVLKQTDAERYLTIWVGPYEAGAINAALQEVEMVRPLTHDLLKNIFNAFNARVTRVEIVKLQDDIFYGNIDGFRFVWADPDCEIAFRIRLFEHYNALRRHQVYTNTIDHHFYHIWHGNSATAILA